MLSDAIIAHAAYAIRAARHSRAPDARVRVTRVDICVTIEFLRLMPLMLIRQSYAYYAAFSFRRHGCLHYVSILPIDVTLPPLIFRFEIDAIVDFVSVTFAAAAITPLLLPLIDARFVAESFAAITP